MAGTNVSEQFLDDHRKFTRAIFHLHQAVQGGDDAEAFRLAVELDRVGGPHIAFEEEVLYPLVAKGGDPQFADQLYSEHDEVRAAVRALLRLDSSQAIPDAARREILAGLETGMHHVESCGTLVSRLMALPEADQQQALARLLELNRAGKRWTELNQDRKRE